jgi:hypothetical protein
VPTCSRGRIFRTAAGKPEVYFRARICSACLKSQYVLRGLPLMRGPHSPPEQMRRVLQVGHRELEFGQADPRAGVNPELSTRRTRHDGDISDSELLKKKQKKNRSSLSKVKGRKGALKAFNRPRSERCRTG